MKVALVAYSHTQARRLSPGGVGGIAAVPELGQLPDVDLTGISDGDIIVWDSGSGTWIVMAPSGGSLSLDDLTDVTITAAASGDRLRFDGAVWVNSPLRWEPHISYDGTVVFDGNGNPVMHEVSY